MKKKILLILPVLLLLLLQSCDKDHCWDCFKGTGKQITEERSIGDFYKIRLSDRINLFIVQDTFNRVVVEAGENLMPYVVTTVTDGILEIRDDNRCKWSRSYKEMINVYLTCKSIYMFEYMGAGDIRGLNTIRTDTVELNYWGASGCITLDLDCKMVKVHQHTGCGDAAISGRTDRVYYYNRGNGETRCQNLITGDAWIDSKCTGEAYIYSDHYLKARVQYIGNVYYAGHPSLIDSVVTERGRLIPLD